MAFNQIENSASSSPSFNIFYFGPGHTVYYKETDITPETWPARYLNNYAIARNRLYAYLEHITRNDPESIIITMGDHGAHSLDYIWYTKPDFKQKLKDASVSAADLYLDLCAILFAIKTPAYINLEESRKGNLAACGAQQILCAWDSWQALFTYAINVRV